MNKPRSNVNQSACELVEYNCYSYVLAEVLGDETIKGQGDDAVNALKATKRPLIRYQRDVTRDNSVIAEEIREAIIEAGFDGELEYPLLGEIVNEYGESMHGFLVDEEFTINHQNGNNGPIIEYDTFENILDDECYGGQIEFRFYKIKKPKKVN